MKVMFLMSSILLKQPEVQNLLLCHSNIRLGHFPVFSLPVNAKKSMFYL